ncbi:MAG: DNA mismatch repair protein MutS, partial [Roseiarcus sp.]
MKPDIDKTGEGTGAKLTPMMAQYFEIKAANPDCLLFYRMGDFYELFFDDAEIASRALGIVLTKRGKHEGEDIRMCGVPIERADDYLQRLIAAGHRVAVCEQLEDPAEAKKRGAKSVVKRDVTRLVTPGTLTEDRLLEPGRPNLLVAVERVKTGEGGKAYGLASLDISTGALELSETDEAGLAVELARLEPAEIVAPEVLLAEPTFARLVREARIAAAPFGRDGADPAEAARRVAAFYGVETLDGYGQFSRAETLAAALALAYVERTQIDATPRLAPPVRRVRGSTLEIDAATRANLEFTRTLGGERVGSLLATIDGAKTPGGARLIAERLASPLTDVDEIRRRLDAIEFFVETPALRDALRSVLACAPDLLRALARLGLDRGGPRDLAALRDALAASGEAAALLADAPEAPAAIVDAYARLARPDDELRRELEATLADELPLNKRDGGFVRAGAHPALDEARRLRDESRRVIADMQARYADETGVRQLKIKHNNFLGYYLETPQAAGELLLKPPHAQTFIHRQTMAGAMRFATEALIDLEARIASAADRALGLELELFAELCRRVVERADFLRAVAAALAELDVAAALA